jgi:general stress protein YciG
MDLKGFREDKGVEDYYKSSFDPSIVGGPPEIFADLLEDVWTSWTYSDDQMGESILKWKEIRKGESKTVGTVAATVTFYCVDNIVIKVDEGTEERWGVPINFKAEKLIMLTYEERPEDTIKLRYELEGFDEESCEITALHYLDSEGQENPFNYSGFQELYDILDIIVLATHPSNRENVLKAVRRDGCALELASDTFKADRELVLEAVRNNGWALEYADDSLKADREVVLEAVKGKAYALQHASDTLKADREVVLEAIRDYDHGFGDGEGALQYADESLGADREVVLEAVMKGGYNLEYASDSLKADREFVLEAIRNGGELQYASEELQNDPEIKKAAED